MNPSEAISRLRTAREQVAGSTPANAAQKAAQSDLLDKIDQRIAVCQQDLKLRQEFAANKKQIEDVDAARQNETAIAGQYEALQHHLWKKYEQRPLKLKNLSKDDQKKYLELRAKLNAAAARGAVLDEQRKKLSNRQNEIQGEYQKLRQSSAVGGKLPATPTDSICVPCLEKVASDFVPKQRRQAGGPTVYPGQQKYGNCGIQSSGQVIAAATKTKPDERDLLEESVKDGNAHDVFLGRLRRAVFDEHNPDSGGTTPTQRQAILAKHGVDSEIKKTTKKDLAKAIRDNKGIVVNVDAGVLWDDPQFLGGGHAIVVYDGDFDENGNLTDVYVNDTGAGQQGRKMKIDDFMDAANSNKVGSSMNVTKKPVW